MWLTGASLSSELAFFVSAVNNGLGYIYWIIYVFFYISVTSQHRASVSKHVPFNTFQYVVTWVSLNENKLLIGSMRIIIFSPIRQLCCDNVQSGFRLYPTSTCRTQWSWSTSPKWLLKRQVSKKALDVDLTFVFSRKMPNFRENNIYFSYFLTQFCFVKWNM